MTDWKTATLSELCEINIGRTPPRARPEYWGPGFPWLTIADMNHGRDLSATKDTITDLAVKECNCRPASAGSVLLSFKLSIGKVGIARVPLYTNEAIAALPIKNPPRLQRDYLYWALRSMDLTQGLDRAAKGLTLNKDKLARISIPVPPAAEQRRITDVLDRAEALRTKRRAALALLDTLTRSIFLDMFSQEAAADAANGKARLESITSLITKGTTPTSIGYAFADRGVPFVRVQNLVSGGVDWETDVLFVSVDTHRALSRSQIHEGDVLVSIAGTIGRVAIVASPAPELNCNQAVAIIRPTTDVLPEYLAYWLQAESAQRQMFGAQVTGTISNLSLTQLRNLRLPVPALSRQREFVGRLTQVGKLTASHRASLAGLDSLFASLQRRAFSGRL